METEGACCELTACAGIKHRTGLMKRLYDLLGVLDSEANGLLRVNSMFITLISLMGIFSAAKPRPPLIAIVPCIVALARRWRDTGFILQWRSQRDY